MLTAASVDSLQVKLAQITGCESQIDCGSVRSDAIGECCARTVEFAGLSEPGWRIAGLDTRSCLAFAGLFAEQSLADFGELCIGRFFLGQR